jgi:hypothetical protein
MTPTQYYQYQENLQLANKLNKLKDQIKDTIPTQHGSKEFGYWMSFNHKLRKDLIQTIELAEAELKADRETY